MLAKIAYDEYYNDIGRMMADLGKLLRYNFKLLAAAGCKHIQLDEPLFTVADEDEVHAVEVINSAIEGLPGDIHVSVHICRGNYAVGKEYDGQIGHRYFDTGRYKADLVCGIECSSYLVEYDMAHHYEGLLGDKQLGGVEGPVEFIVMNFAAFPALVSAAQNAPLLIAVTAWCGWSSFCCWLGDGGAIMARAVRVTRPT